MELQKGVVNFRIHADCVNDITTSSVQRIYYIKEGETVASYWTATRGTSNVTLEDGTTLEANTYVYYDTVADDIDTVGDWRVQAYVELSGGYIGYGTDGCRQSWANMTVKGNLA